MPNTGFPAPERCGDVELSGIVQTTKHFWRKYRRSLIKSYRASIRQLLSRLVGLSLEAAFTAELH